MIPRRNNQHNALSSDSDTEDDQEISDTEKERDELVAPENDNENYRDEHIEQQEEPPGEEEIDRDENHESPDESSDESQDVSQEKSKYTGLQKCYTHRKSMEFI